MIVDQETIKNLMNKISEIEMTSSKKSEYIIDGKRVPRVTEVLSAMLHEDSLMSWSNSLGWKRISYRAFMKEAAEKGTYTHLAIERFLKDGKVDLDKLQIPNEKVRTVVQSTMTAFFDWWRSIKDKYEKVNVVFTEETLIHSYFGGTCDCLLNLDGKFWLVDFKTSNHMSYNYSLQLAAYRFLLRELKGIEISGCTILLLDKENYSYRTYDLDFSEQESLSFIEDCEQTFLILVAAFKMRLLTTNEYYKIYGIERKY